MPASIPWVGVPTDSTMNLARLINQLQTLPEDKRAEVLDFVEFLAARAGAEPSGSQEQHAQDWSDADFAQMAWQQALRGMEDEPVLYTVSDLKEVWS